MVLNACNNLGRLSQLTNINPIPLLPPLLYRYTFANALDVSTNGYALNRATGLYDGSFVGLAQVLNMSSVGNGSGHTGNTTGKCLNPGSYNTTNGVYNHTSYLMSNYIPSALTNGTYSTAGSPNGVSISFWIHMLKNDTLTIMFSFFNSNPNTVPFDLEIANKVGQNTQAGHLYMHRIDPGSNDYTALNTNSDTNLFPLDTWAHVAITYQYNTGSGASDGKITVYSNGKYYGTNGAQTGTTNPNTVTSYTYNCGGTTSGLNPNTEHYGPYAVPQTCTFRLGWTNVSQYAQLPAYVDDFRMYNGILMQSQVNQIYTATD